MTPPLDLLSPATSHRPPATIVGRKLIIDNFAGAGGASEGIKQELGRDPDYAINHSNGALVMHRANHPGTVHLCDDVFHVDPRTVVGPDGRVGLAWFSPDCTHFSAARGSKPVSHRVRGLAWVVIRWVKKLDPEQRPEVIIIENVREFLTWGPLIKKRDSRGRICRDKQGRVLEIPDPKRKGVTFKRWKTTLENYGYKVEYKILDAADYGAPTHRKRLFIIARRDGKPIVWPEKTHGPVGECSRSRVRELFEPANSSTRKLPYRTAAECIDWNIKCPSIFLNRKEARQLAKILKLGGLKRPLADKTMSRSAHGVLRYIMRYRQQGKLSPFIVGLGGRMGQSPERSVDRPAQTCTTKADSAVVVPGLIQMGYGEREGQTPRALDVEKPLDTITGKARFAVTQAVIGRAGTYEQRVKRVRAFIRKYLGHLDLTEKEKLGIVEINGEDWQIVDIGMRMLTPRELARCQGFDDSYVFTDKSKSDQVARIGNSVPPPVVKAIVSANYSDEPVAAEAA